jgi:hypothetical protein
MKPLSPFSDGVDRSNAKAQVARKDVAIVDRYYAYAAWAFVWSPLLLITMFYVGDAWAHMLPILRPLFVVAVFANPLALLVSLVVLFASSRKSRWLFVTLDVVVLSLECVLVVLGIAGSPRIYQ